MRRALRIRARPARMDLPVPSPRLRGEGQGEGRLRAVRPSHGRLSRLLGFLALVGSAFPASATPPTLTFDATSATASGLTASGQAVFLGVMRLPKVYYQEVYTVRKVIDADATGTAQLPVEPEVGRRSVWAVVDLATGELAVAAPEDYPLNEVPFAAEAIGRDVEGKPSRVSLSQQVAEVLLVRPGAGAWSLEAVDGDPQDGDGEVDGAVTLSVTNLTPLAQAAAPEELVAGDVLVVLDPNALTFRAATLTTALLGEEGN